MDATVIVSCEDLFGHNADLECVLAVVVFVGLTGHPKLLSVKNHSSRYFCILFMKWTNIC